MNKIKAIGFDYGGVVVGDSNAWREFNVEISSLLGISVDEYRKLYFSMNHLVNTGEVSGWEEFWPRLLANINKQDKLKQVLEITHQYSSKYTVVNHNVLELIKSLKRNGYKVGLLSNATAEAGKEFRKIGMDKHFDVFHVSGETGKQKPDPAAFVNFVKALGVKISELVFIDDTEKSLSTAKECGFVPHLYKNYEGLIKYLDKLGITY